MRSKHWAFCLLAAGGLLCGLLAACTSAVQVTGAATPSTADLTGIHKIQHVIIVMQENRSFDNYFGTYPGADGIPMRHGVPAVCVRAPGSSRDVMGYHTAGEIPNYWAYAKHFVLQDHMYEPVKSWSLPDHLYMVSAWSARCKNTDPKSCVNNIGGPEKGPLVGQAAYQAMTTGTAPINMAWTDITWLLHAHHVSWAYYVQKGTQPDCAYSGAACTRARPTSPRSSTPP